MSQSANPVAKRPGVDIQTLVRFVLIVIGVQVLGAILQVLLLKDWQVRSSFGEMFGGINTLFSGLAFAGVIYTILLQRHELELQRESQSKSEELMVLTAKLSALNSLVEATSRRLVDMKERRDPADEIGSVNEELQAYLKQIRTILNKWLGTDAV